MWYALGCAPLNSERFMRRSVYHNLYVLNLFLKNEGLRPIHLMDCVKMVQYHDLGPWLPTLSILDTLGPEKSDPNLISSVRPFSKMAAFQCGRFHFCRECTVSIGVKITRRAPGLSTLNWEENKRVDINQYCSFGWKNCRTSKYFWLLNMLYLALVAMGHPFGPLSPTLLCAWNPTLLYLWFDSRLTMFIFYHERHLVCTYGQLQSRPLKCKTGPLSLSYHDS